MRSGIVSGILAGLTILIWSCQSARLSASEKEKRVDNAADILPSLRFPLNAPEPSKRASRCFTSLRKYVYGDDGILSGDPNDVRFLLYPNPLNKNAVEEIKYGDAIKLKENNLFPAAQLKIVIHGFTKSYTHESMQLIKDAYLDRMADTVRRGGPPFNVIIVDWEPLGKPRVDTMQGIFYRLAVRNIPVVGKRVGEFIQFLIENGVVKSLKDVHIVGFSLGAHVAGGAGKTLKEINAGEPPARITGLDPAGPSFYEGLAFSHPPLHKTDARFVDVIHTNMGALGTLSTVGHADFYPNGGGPVQARCEEEYEQKKRTQSGNLTGGIWDTKLLAVNSCSHNKAPQFFSWSILNTEMLACKCENYKIFKNGCACTETAIFGEYCDSRARGTFYLDV